jgi:hypothetical protein
LRSEFGEVSKQRQIGVEAPDLRGKRDLWNTLMRRADSGEQISTLASEAVMGSRGSPAGDQAAVNSSSQTLAPAEPTVTGLAAKRADATQLPPATRLEALLLLGVLAWIPVLILAFVLLS